MKTLKMLNKKNIIRLCAIAMLIAMLLGLWGCGSHQTKEPSTGLPEMHEEISYDLYGAWITAAGEVQKAVDFHISGQVDMQASGEDSMTLDISFPDSVPYEFTEKTEFVSQSRKYLGLSYFEGTGFSWSHNSNKFVVSYLFLCPEKEYVLLHWRERPDCYLVASTEPETEYEQILDYFADSLQGYNIGN